MSTPIRMDFAQVQELSSYINTRCAALRESRDELKGYVNGLVTDEWDGDAMNEFNEAQRLWDQAFEGLVDILQSLSKAVEDGVVSMQEQERMNTARFGG